MNYFKLTPRERVKLGYITWTDNFKLGHGNDVVKCYFGERFFISVSSFLRFLFNCSVSFPNIKDLKLNMSQLDIDKK